MCGTKSEMSYSGKIPKTRMSIRDYMKTRHGMEITADDEARALEMVDLTMVRDDTTAHNPNSND